MRLLFTSMVLLYAIASKAQLQSATLTATGLTCSMCSKATFKKLQAIEGVEKISTDLDNTRFVLSFNKVSGTTLSSIKTQVEAAGFSVGKLVLKMKVVGMQASSSAFSMQGLQYTFLEPLPSKKDGIIAVQVLNKGFVTEKEYKKYAATFAGSSTATKGANNQYFIKLL